jgi:hypothetical protein
MLERVRAVYDIHRCVVPGERLPQVAYADTAVPVRPKETQPLVEPREEGELGKTRSNSIVDVLPSLRRMRSATEIEFHHQPLAYPETSQEARRTIYRIFSSRLHIIARAADHEAVVAFMVVHSLREA